MRPSVALTGGSVRGVRASALNWLAEAEADLKRAKRALRDGDYALSTFMSQQACERVLKAAFIALAREVPPRAHDLTVLYSRLSGRLELPEPVAARLAEVSQYYVVSRYPNAGLERPSESITREQAVRALEVAERVVGSVREKLRGGGAGA